jgi:hypothetical protein
MTGRLVGTFNGSPVELVAAETANHTQVTLMVSSPLAAWQLRGKSCGLTLVLRSLQAANFELSLVVASLRLRVLPVPSVLVRWFGPQLPAT